MATDLIKEFFEYHEANPEVYELFKKFMGEIIEAGWVRYSSDAICHRIRWEKRVHPGGDIDFKINDHYTAFYARLYIRDHPENKGFFETRASVADLVFGDDEDDTLRQLKLF